MYCWEAAKKSQAAITELLLFRKSTGVIIRDAHPALKRRCANGPFEDCEVKMFVKQRALPSANVCEAAARTVNSLHDVPTYTYFLSTSHWHAFKNAGLIAKCECL